MTIQVTSENNRFYFLRRVLQANSFFSAISGAILTFGAQPAAAFLGLEPTWVLIVIGISLLFYAAGLFQTAAREPLNRQFAITAIIMFTNRLPLTTAGWWAVAIVADVVAIFAAFQFYGLRQGTR
jgi:hypothetical protein